MKTLFVLHTSALVSPRTFAPQAKVREYCLVRVFPVPPLDNDYYPQWGIKSLINNNVVLKSFYFIKLPDVWMTLVEQRKVCVASKASVQVKA
ncbi:hypothetical protein AVEN_215957-1 [Araneus ventricosus]|uniref:Uncharacterized protein n=1 Tax=Araneus ventricosus TaxID=182803 RepID=A0A4Y2MH70_ARAVE|nr:hypothetical protein AVEN_215957-1 [Araneus ventricosus]